jgi:ankyrin repeat protein
VISPGPTSAAKAPSKLASFMPGVLLAGLVFWQAGTLRMLTAFGAVNSGATWLAKFFDPKTVRSDHGDTLLHAAVWRGNLDSVKWFFEAGAEKEVGPKSLGEMLQYAISQKQTEMVSFLLSMGVEYFYDSSLLSPLHWAARTADAKTLRLFLGKDVDLDASNPYDGGTALHEAASSGNLETIKALLEAGADPLVKTIHGETAQDKAAMQGYEAAAALLKGAMVNAKGK